MYDHAEKHKMKPPNVKEIGEPAKRRLEEEQRTATLTRIQKLAEDPRHTSRRGRLGLPAAGNRGPDPKSGEP
jgi:hypothetical protein